MNIVKNTDYIGEARKRLLQQFKGLPRIDGMLQAFMAEVQSIENAAYDVLVLRLLDNNPSGDVEDKIGSIVGQLRNGASDDQYRIFITARIKANRSDGKRQTLLDITSLLVNQNTPILFRVFVPKSIEIEVDNVPANPYTIWHDFLNIAKAAGENLRFFFSMTTTQNVLRRTSVSGGVTTVSTQRKGSVSGPYGGGVFAGCFGGF